MALSFVAQAARAGRPPVAQTEVEKGATAAERFLIRWRGEADPDHVKAIDAYWISAAEHGMNASTFTARVVASTGADCAAALSSAVGALSGPLHGGAPVARADDARRGRGARRRRPLGQGRAGPRRAPDGLRPPRLSRRGPARSRAAAHGARAGLRALRGRRGARDAPRSPSCARASPTACSRRTSSSGRPSCSISPRYRRRCSPACSRARASRAGRRTSSSRNARDG